MARRIEWRTRGGMDGTLLVLDDDEATVLRAVELDSLILRDFLNEMEDLPPAEGPPPQEAQPPEAWGDLVLARAATGEVLQMDPERYWDAIYLWFRSRGLDPHPASTTR